ncbi:MAG: RluA family pseudouridine synthase [Clostridiales bacterium]|nr:RluA family pseudouridine synthase [Clostridiales bacterium]
MKRQDFEVTEQFDGERVDKFLAGIYTEVSRTFFQKLIAEGNVCIQYKIVNKNSARVEAGDIVTVKIPDAKSVDIEPENIPLDILYEDDDLLVVNKPKGMVVHPSPGHLSGTLVNAVMYHCGSSLSGINGEIRPGIVHRIDKDTTGSIIVCKNDTAHANIAEQIKNHTVNRTYRGIVCGSITGNGLVDAPIARSPKDRKKMAVVDSSHGKRAVTHYKVLSNFKKHTYMEFKLETGRTHQIRVHMAHIHHPVLGDEMYGGSNRDYMIKGVSLEGQTLHAMTLGFVQPSTGEYIEVNAALPEYFEDLLNIL